MPFGWNKIQDTKDDIQFMRSLNCTNQTEQSERIRAKGTYVENDNGCSRIGLGSCSGDDNNRIRRSTCIRQIQMSVKPHVIQSARTCSYTDANEEAKSVHIKKYLLCYTNGQRDYRIFDKEMDGNGRIASTCNEDQIRSSRLGSVIDNTIPSGNIEQESGCVKSPSQKTTLYSEKRVSLPSKSGMGVESIALRLHDSNEQTFRRILQIVTRSLRHCYIHQFRRYLELLLKYRRTVWKL
ncbi:MAG: hypothetical protein EZS28_005979 [Streblomastix strix]|uniref:Uncharacterized protein n=1 Tax=Streblomastix strix TaxID=222440 RepID=A0A5J4WW91_9EUKA|nr:MAG: hypothetical protein EZS28_005979 [Streblomastix strix]